MKRKMVGGSVLVLLLLLVVVSVASASLSIQRNNCAHLIMGDVNRDGEVSLPDLSIIASAYGKRQGEEGYQVRADLNCNSGIDDWDVEIYTLGYRMWVDMIGVPHGVEK